MKVTVEALMNYLRGLPPEAPILLGVQSVDQEGNIEAEYREIDDIIYSVRQGTAYINSDVDPEEY